MLRILVACTLMDKSVIFKTFLLLRSFILFVQICCQKGSVLDVLSAVMILIRPNVFSSCASTVGGSRTDRHIIMELECEWLLCTPSWVQATFIILPICPISVLIGRVLRWNTITSERSVKLFQMKPSHLWVFPAWVCHINSHKVGER